MRNLYDGNGRRAPYRVHRYPKYEYALLTYDMIRIYGGIISMLVAYNRTDQGRLRYIDERKLELREEFAELEKIDLTPRFKGRLISELRHDYFILLREQKSILRKPAKQALSNVE